MKGMIFKKAFLLGGIFLLAPFMLAQSSWGCDDDDKSHCDHHGNPCHPPKIQIVYLEYEANSIVFEILGKNFDNGVTPVVTLGGIYDLTLVEPVAENQIVAELYPIPEGFKYGDYRLVVSTCHDSACKDKYCKDHGPNCKCKYCRDHCSKFKDKYCKDNEYRCRCKDRYSLTIPDPSGQQGMIRPEIVKSEGRADIPNQVVEGSASCRVGYTVTGGGFSASKSVTILVNKPLDEGRGWFVSGIVDGESAKLEVYVVCVQMQ